MTLENSERRRPLTQNQHDILYHLTRVGSAPMTELVKYIETEDDMVDAITSVIAESKIQGLIEPTSPYYGKGKTKWKATPRGRALLNDYNQ